MSGEASKILSVREGYAAWASQYDHDGNPLIALEGPALFEMIDPVFGKTVVDLGAGTGRHSLPIAEAGARVIGIDSSPQMLWIAAQKSAGLGPQAPLWMQLELPARIPIADRSVDAVIFGLAAEHIQALDRVLQEVVRILRPGGYCVLSSMHPDQLLAGQCARFIDPETGIRSPIVTIPRSIDDYLDIGRSVGLTLQLQKSLGVDETLAARLPRAQRYLGKNLGWVVRWSLGT